MRNRMLCLAAILLVCVIAFFANWYIDATSENTGQRIHQHLDAEAAKPCEHKESDFCTHLPLVSIDTGGQTLKEERGQELICQVKIYDKEGVNHHLTDKSDIKTTAAIHIRGASSRHFKKHSYRLEFRHKKKQQEKRDIAVMGMEADCDWILNGPYLDRSLMRNYLMYNLSGEIMDWAPNVRYCEVFLNGDYQGVYLMLENIKVDRNRLNLEEYNPKQAESSYLIERNRDDTTKDKIVTFANQAGYNQGEVGVLYPRKRDMTKKTREWLKDDINEMEKLLYSLDYDEWDYGYTNFLDVDSFVDYVVINEFSLNLDAGSYSTYAYKTLGGKLSMGPVWDFNNAFGMYDVNKQEFFMQRKPWFVMLMKDEKFVKRVIGRYRALRKTYLSEDYLMNYIDETRAYLGPAVKRNFAKWGYTVEAESVNDPRKDIDSYDKAVDQLKSFMKKRLRFMDDHIDVLQQYCHESMVKPFN